MRYTVVLILVGVPSKQSMMPEGILEPLPETEMRALIAYLQRSEPLSK